MKSFFQGNIEYYAEEIEINGKFRTFAKNAAIVFAGHNTVTAQLKIKSARGIIWLFVKSLEIVYSCKLKRTE